jgi:hypothetical protein
MEPRTRFIAIGVAAAILGTAAGWWGYSAHQKRELGRAIVALVADTGMRVRSVLSATADDPEAARKYEEHAAAVERNLARLKELDAAREQALADAADDYILTSREILKRVVESARYRRLLAESLQALNEHMNADTRTGAWVQEAVKARERVNRDHRGYSAAAAALDKLLQDFPGSQKKVAPRVEPAVLIEGALIESARARALEGSKQAQAEVEKTRQLGAFR